MEWNRDASQSQIWFNNYEEQSIGQSKGTLTKTKIDIVVGRESVLLLKRTDDIALLTSGENYLDS